MNKSEFLARYLAKKRALGNNDMLLEIEKEADGKENIVLKRYIGSSKIIKVPEFVDKISEESIFDYGIKKELEGIVLPANITEIPKEFARECFKLSFIDAPGVVTIGYGAFQCCFELEELKASNKLQNIGTASFYSCYSLKYIPTLNIRHIGEQAFGMCNILQINMELPKVESIGDYAFSNSGITELHIGGPCRHIGHDIVNGCILGNLSFGDGIPKIINSTFCKVTSYGDEPTYIPRSIKEIEPLNLYTKDETSTGINNMRCPDIPCDDWKWDKEVIIHADTYNRSRLWADEAQENGLKVRVIYD